jgi:hypothetical protein
LVVEIKTGSHAPRILGHCYRVPHIRETFQRGEDAKKLCHGTVHGEHGKLISVFSVLSSVAQEFVTVLCRIP